MTGRLSSGNPRIDAVLGGGLPADGIHLLVGMPGSGKTILAQQYVFHNATRDRPGVYLSTVSEPLEKILRHGQSLEFFDVGAVGDRIFYEDLGETLNEGGLPAILDGINRIVRERGPAILVIDSFKALHPYAEGEGDFRRFLHELAGRLSALPMSSLWVGEYTREEVGTLPEFAVADAIVALSTDRVAERELRLMQVLKLRGSGFHSGRHAFRLSASGLDVFPRLADPGEQVGYELAESRSSSGIPILDGMLRDGYWAGASTLVAGPSGAGKTLMGLHFAFNGASSGEPAVIATLQENHTQLARIAAGFGWSLDGDGLEVMYRTPVDLYLDEWVYDLLERVETSGARRVVIDSLGDLSAISPDPVRFREYVYSLIQRCSRRGVSVLMTQEVPELFGVTRLSEYGISHLSDNVVLLQFFRAESRIKRAVTILKTRASDHDSEIREFEITPRGFVLGERYVSDEMVP